MLQQAHLCENKSKIYTADTSDCCGIRQMQQEALVPAATAW